MVGYHFPGVVYPVAHMLAANAVAGEQLGRERAVSDKANIVPAMQIEILCMYVMYVIRPLSCN